MLPSKENKDTRNEEVASIRSDNSNNNPQSSDSTCLEKCPPHLSENSEPHCIHSKMKKLMIVGIASSAVMVSPLSGQIYYPALTPISKDFNVSTSLVNLTITVYMVFQAISPSFWGPLSDLWGRRPVYVGTLLVYIGVCVGLAMVPTFPALLVLRMFQAFGSSSTIALSAGVLGDITTPAERGSYFGLLGSCRTSSGVIGPVLGGIIAHQLSWRWVFWILLIKGSIDLILIFFFVPETLRSLVGNGSGYANPTPTQWFKRRLSKNNPATTTTPSSITPAGKSRFRQMPDFIGQLLFLRYPDIILIMIINGSYMAIQFTLLTTTPTHFSAIYGLNTLQIGLCYIPYGVGCIIGSYIVGRILDHDYSVVAWKHGMSTDEVKKSGKLSLDFPIYRARLRSSWIQITLGQLVIILYGWTLYAKVHLAVPLVLQFLAGLSVGPMMNVCQTLMVDLFPGRGASITAASNLVRSMLGAGATAVIEPAIDCLGLGWTFTVFGILLLINTAFIPILIKFGSRWREDRERQQQ